MNGSCSQNMLNLSGASAGRSSLWSAARHTNVVEWCGTLNRLRALQATTCNNVPMCMRLHGSFVSLILQAEFQLKPSALHNNSVWGAASKLSSTQWAVQLGHLREIKASTPLLPYCQCHPQSVFLSIALAGRVQLLYMETSAGHQRNVESTLVDPGGIPTDLTGLEDKGRRLVCVPQARRLYAAVDGMQRMPRLVPPCVCEHQCL